jgi:hypothetical protein
MKQDQWTPERNAGNLYTPSERPGGIPAKRSFPTVPAAIAFTALLVFAASIYLAAYAAAGKNEQRRRTRADEVQAAEARISALCAILDARVGSTCNIGEALVAQGGDTSQHTDFVMVPAAGAAALARGAGEQAWLTSGKEGVARLIAGFSARVARPASAEASTLSKP